MTFFRTFQHLLPKAEAWKIRDTATTWTIGDGHRIGDPGLVIGGTTGGSFLARLFKGLAAALDPIRDFFDGIFGDAFPTTTRELAAWEAQFGIEADPSDTVRRQALAAEWAATGGQSPSYIQGVLQTAGFNVYVHEWWASGPPYVARDPRAYTLQPLIGSVQCQPTNVLLFPNQPQCQPSNDVAFPNQPECDRFLVNDPHYFVNKNLTDVAPPRIPDDPSTWVYFIYLGAAVFPNFATVPAARRSEFERLVLKICPEQQWIVTLINFT